MRRGGRAVLGRALRLLASLALCGATSTCGGERPRSADERPLVTEGELGQLAARVDSLFVASLGGAAGDSARALAFARAEELVREVARSERPRAGWERTEFAKQLGRYGLVCEVQEIGSEEPWLILLRQARQPDAAPRAFLLYAESGGTVRLPDEPFANAFEAEAWLERGEGRFAVLGWERGRAGLHPKAWLFRLPKDASLSSWRERLLPPVAEQYLCEGAARSVAWLAGVGEGAPRVQVVGASRANSIFEECASCPHLEADLVYGVALEHFVLMEETPRRSPYAAFVAFLGELARGDTAAVLRRVADPVVLDTAREYGFDRPPRRGRWRAAPGTSAGSLEQIHLRGEEGAFRVLLSVRDSSFVVSSIVPTEFVID